MWLKILLFMIALVVVICLISIWYASTHFHKVYYRLSSDKISKPVKFVVLSDLHDQTYGSRNEKLLKAIEEENPEAILIAGDILTPCKNREKVAEALIENLAKKYQVYYGIGNHEAKMNWDNEYFGNLYDTYINKIKDTGAKVLSNKYLDMEKYAIRIYGLDMEHIYYKRLKCTPMDDAYVETKLGKADENYYNILLAHNPTYFDKYAKWNPDLVLSGHLHGGLVRLPGLGGVIAPSLQLFPKYDGGKFIDGNSTLIVSRGLGRHGIQFRMWNPAELIILELSQKS